MLGDHYPRIYAQHQQAIENAAMEGLERRAAPLFWSVIAAIVALMVVEIVNDTSAYIDHHSELVVINDALVKCINGQVISLGDATLKCEVREYKPLVAGLAAGSQP